MWDSDTGIEVAGSLRGLDRQLAGSAVEVLETMFFEFPIAGLEEGPPPCAGLGALVEFAGSSAGCLEVDVDEPVASRLAASFLGREDESTVTGPEIRLVLLELANMLCGNALSHLEPGGQFQLAAPRLFLAEAEKADGWLVAPLESGRLALRLTFSGPQ